VAAFASSSSGAGKTRCEQGKYDAGNLLGVHPDVTVHAVMNTR
jgi:hypothetical protein